VVCQSIFYCGKCSWFDCWWFLCENVCLLTALLWLLPDLCYNALSWLVVLQWTLIFIDILFYFMVQQTMTLKGLWRFQKHVSKHLVVCACGKPLHMLNYLLQNSFHTASAAVTSLLLCCFEEFPTIFDSFPYQLAVILWHDQQINCVLIMPWYVFCNFLHCRLYQFENPDTLLAKLLSKNILASALNAARTFPFWSNYFCFLFFM